MLYPQGPGSVLVVEPAKLQPKQVAAWRSMIAANPQLASPFFSPEYTQAVARVVPHVHVGILDRDGCPVAFLPFELHANGIGKRLHLCDYQGLVSMPEHSYDMKRFVRECGLRAWDFDHLLASQHDFVQFHRRSGVSHVIELTKGFDVYVDERNATGTKQIKKVRNLERRLEREHGQLRFELHVADPKLLAQLLEWRTLKYPASRHRPEVLASILNEMLSTQSPHCQATLSVLYVNDRIAACHFGLRSAGVWHYWFPAYNPDFELYSPGNTLLLRMAEIAPSIGIDTIDLGKGEQDYKKRFANRTIVTAEGYVSASNWLSLMRILGSGAKRGLHNTPFLSSLSRRIRRTSANF